LGLGRELFLKADSLGQELLLPCDQAKASHEMTPRGGSDSHNLRMTQIFLWDIDRPIRVMIHAIRSFIATPSREAGVAGRQGFDRLKGKMRRALHLPSRKGADNLVG
jgi:hypothetical protein